MAIIFYPSRYGDQIEKNSLFASNSEELREKLDSLDFVTSAQPDIKKTNKEKKMIPKQEQNFPANQKKESKELPKLSREDKDYIWRKNMAFMERLKRPNNSLDDIISIQKKMKSLKEKRGVPINNFDTLRPHLIYYYLIFEHYGPEEIVNLRVEDIEQNEIDNSIDRLGFDNFLERISQYQRESQ